MPRIAAHAVFYPAAAAYAALALPASMAAMLGHAPALAGLASPAGHAHEMVFGFALAAVAGNQLGPVSGRLLATLLAAWIAGRAAFVFLPATLLAALANALFAGLLALQVAPRLASVRKLRNRALPAAIVALCAAAVAFHAVSLAGAAARGRVLLAAVLALAMLMAFMGGRIIAPTAAGHFHREGGDLAARVQPRLEGATLAAMLVAIATAALGADRAAAAALAVAGSCTATRLVRWRPWTVRGRADIACLGVGYAWLAAGMAAIAFALWTGARPVEAMHVVTIGALGTLSINVMAITEARVARRDPAGLRWPVAATILVAASLAARLVPAWKPEAAPAAWWLAAALWAAAFATLLAFARGRR